MHLELINCGATAPGTGAACVPYGQDSMTIKNSRGIARVVGAWANSHAAGFMQVTKPSGHDTTRGWRQTLAALTPNNALPAGMSLNCEPQELLSVVIAGSAAGGEIENVTLMVHYEDLPGVEGRFSDGETLLERADLLKMVTV